MSRSLFVSLPGRAWNGFDSGRPVLVLDPADTHFGLLGRVALFENGRPVMWSFVGGINPLRVGSRIISATARMAKQLPDSLFVVAPAFRPNSTMVSLLATLEEIIEPDQVLIDPEIEWGYHAWKVEPIEPDLGPAASHSIQAALRKAHWLKHRQRCERHVLPLSSLSFQHGRLGTGISLPVAEAIHAGLEGVDHVERLGQNLFIVSQNPVHDSTLARALDITHTQRAQITHPRAYENLLVAVADGNGQDLGCGTIEEIDFVQRTLTVWVDAVVPSPISIVRLGAFYVDESGKELGEPKPDEV